VIFNTSSAAHGVAAGGLAPGCILYSFDVEQLDAFDGTHCRHGCNYTASVHGAGSRHKKRDTSAAAPHAWQVASPPPAPAAMQRCTGGTAACLDGDRAAGRQRCAGGLRHPAWPGARHSAPPCGPDAAYDRAAVEACPAVARHQRLVPLLRAGTHAVHVHCMMTVVRLCSSPTWCQSGTSSQGIWQWHAVPFPGAGVDGIAGEEHRLRGYVPDVITWCVCCGFAALP
jgi:hypothetical protein